jgi:hypothetical protein
MSNETTSVIKGSSLFLLNWFHNSTNQTINLTKYNRHIVDVQIAKRFGEQTNYYNSSYYQFAKLILLEPNAACLIKAKSSFELPFGALLPNEEIKIDCKANISSAEQTTTIIKYPFKSPTYVKNYDSIIKVEQINNNCTGLIATELFEFNKFYLVTFTKTFDIINPKYLPSLSTNPVIVSKQSYEFSLSGCAVFGEQYIGIAGYLTDILYFNSTNLNKQTLTLKQMKIFVKGELRMTVSFDSDRLNTEFSYEVCSETKQTFTGLFTEGNVML